MAPITVQPIALDVALANGIARHIDPRVERTAKLLTWGADEKLLLAAAVIGWTCSRRSSARTRELTDHILAATIAAAIFPHAVKRIVDQERPDRRTVRGHWRGVPFSGAKYDAFPSGHAVHVGALASAATLLPPRWRTVVWAVGGVLVSTRVVLLAHWLTDVVAGLAIGVGIERLLRKFTLSEEHSLAEARDHERSGFRKQRLHCCLGRPSLSFTTSLGVRRPPHRRSADEI